MGRSGRGGMSTATLLGVSFLCVLVIGNSESASDDGIAAPLSCVLCADLQLYSYLLGDKLIAADCSVLALRLPVSALLAFKRAIYEDPLSKLSDWNSKDKDPCAWSGVGCSPFNNRVVTL
jgi:hypothetical protein